MKKKEHNSIEEDVKLLKKGEVDQNEVLHVFSADEDCLKRMKGRITELGAVSMFISSDLFTANKLTFLL